MENRRRILYTLMTLAIICQSVLAMPSRVKRQDSNDAVIQADLNPNENQESVPRGLDREKRKLPEATFGAKNAILGFVFGENDDDNVVNEKTEMKRNERAAAVTITKTKDESDAAELDRGMVMLELPEQLFSQSFTTVTNISKLIGNFISNSARRYARVVYFFKPLFGNALTVEGHDYIPTTTTRKPN